MATPTYGSGKTICNYENLLKRIVEDRHVVFNVTSDPEAMEILNLIRANGLERYFSIHVDVVMQFKAMKFFRNLRVITSQELESTVKGREISIINSNLIRLFGLPIMTI